MQGCGPGCHCVKRAENYRLEAVKGLVSDSIDKFMPCDILKDEWEKLKGELLELREKAVEKGALASAITEAATATGDNAPVSFAVNEQTAQLEALLQMADQMGVQADQLKTTVRREQIKEILPERKTVQITVPAKAANTGTQGMKGGPG